MYDIPNLHLKRGPLESNRKIKTISFSTDIIINLLEYKLGEIIRGWDLLGKGCHRNGYHCTIFYLDTYSSKGEFMIIKRFQTSHG